MKNAKLWLSVLLISLGVASCQKPPKGPIGIIGNSGCVYRDESLPEDRMDYILSFPECVNHVATSPDHYRVVLHAYKECRAVPPGPMCIVGDSGCNCFDSTPPGRAFELTFRECLNHVVTTIDYFRILTQWYERRCAE